MTSRPPDDVEPRFLLEWGGTHGPRRDWLPIGLVRGDDSQGGVRFGWEEKIVGTPNFQFRRIEIRVFAEEQPDQALVSLTGFMVKPGG